MRVPSGGSSSCQRVCLVSAILVLFAGMTASPSHSRRSPETRRTVRSVVTSRLVMVVSVSFVCFVVYVNVCALRSALPVFQFLLINLLCIVNRQAPLPPWWSWYGWRPAPPPNLDGQIVRRECCVPHSCVLLPLSLSWPSATLGTSGRWVCATST